MAFAGFANLIVVLHALFILFVVFGGLLVFWRPWFIWVHAPIALYGVLIEWVGWVCPLTPLENWLRRQAGQAGYDGGFVEVYILPLVYPGALTRNVAIALGAIVLAVNAIIYTAFFLRR